MAVIQGLCEYEGSLWAIWKGMENDDRLFYSQWNGGGWVSQTTLTSANPGVASTAGPAASSFGGRLFLAWRGSHNTARGHWGEDDDQRIWWMQYNGHNGANDWFGPHPMGPGSFVSLYGPALATFRGGLYAAWRGGANLATGQEDYAIRIASTGNAGSDGNAPWSSPVLIPGAQSPWGPSLAVAPNGQLFALWADTNGRLTHSSSPDGSTTWSAPQAINQPGFVSWSQPALAVHDGVIWAAWRGGVTPSNGQSLPTDDQQLYFSFSFDNGASWCSVQEIPGGFSYLGVAIASFDNTVHALWSGADFGGTDQNLWHSSIVQGSFEQPKPGPGLSGPDVDHDNDPR